jgi:hypothetical protein
MLKTARTLGNSVVYQVEMGGILYDNRGELCEVYSQNGLKISKKPPKILATSPYAVIIEYRDKLYFCHSTPFLFMVFSLGVLKRCHATVIMV